MGRKKGKAGGFTLRRASLADLDTIVEFNLRLARESEGLELDPATVTAGVRAVLEDLAKGTYHLAEADGRVAAQLMITVEWSDWRNGPIWWLQSVYVDPPQRGRGLFRALFAEVEVLARGAGARALRLYVEEKNRGAREAYRRLGMRRSGYQLYELEPLVAEDDGAEGAAGGVPVPGVPPKR